MKVTARKYNPGFLSDEELISSYCVRLDSFESMVESLRECTGNSNTHQIVIGPRGSGKTSLLLRVAAEIRRDESLSSRFLPVVFAEESYEVSTAGEFWLECLSRLAEQVPLEPNVPELKRSCEELRCVSDDQMLGDRCLGALQDYADRVGRRLVLIVENLNMMFRDFSNRDAAGWRLRHTLQTEQRLILLASATSRFDDISNPKCAFYELLREITLHPLEPEACAILWQTVSGRDRPPETISALRILTGGNPRLLTIVARFGANLSFRELMADLLDLVDDHTEYFKSHLDALPAQERRVYLTLAKLWIPATTREIADGARSDTNKCSAQLARLVERGAVEVIGGSARRKQYYLTERLYNIYYLMRCSRGTAPMVEALIQFMEAYYSTSEMKDFVIRTVREALSLDDEAKKMHQFALDRLLESPLLLVHREELSTLGSWTHSHSRGESGAAKNLFDKALKIAEMGYQSDAIALWDELLQQLNASTAEADLELVATALTNKGIAQKLLKQTEEAITTWDEVILRFGTSKAPKLISAVVAAFSRKAVGLHEQGQLKEALALCNDALHRFEQGGVAQRSPEIAEVFHIRGFVLRDLGRLEEALENWDETIARLEVNDSTMDFTIVLSALVGKVTILIDLNRLEEALDVWSEILKHSVHSDDPPVNLIDISLASKSILLDVLGRKVERLAFLDEIVQQLSESDNYQHILAAIHALTHIGDWLADQKRFQEALATWDEIVRRFGSMVKPEICDAVAFILVRKGETLAQMNRKEEALLVWEDIVHRFGSSDTTGARDSVAMSLLLKGDVFADLKRPQDVVEVMDEVIHRFGSMDAAPSLQNSVSAAFLCKALALIDLDRLPEALATYDEMLNRKNVVDTLNSEAILAETLFAKGRVLVYLKRPEAALFVWDDVVQRFGTSDQPGLLNKAISAQLKIAELHLTMEQGDTSVSAVDYLLEQLETETPESLSIRCQGHFTRARANLIEGNKAACMRDVETALSILSEISSLPRDVIDSLFGVAVELGPAQLRELIISSPVSDRLLPLTTALERDIGLETRVAKEIEEVSDDIQQDLDELRNRQCDKGNRIVPGPIDFFRDR